VEGIPLTALTPWGAILFMVILIVGLVARGKLVPKATVDALLTAQEQRLADRDATNDDLTEANRALTEAVRTMTAQMDETMELGRTAHAIIRALPQVRGGERDAGP
jgi:hypothetical protein